MIAAVESYEAGLFKSHHWKTNIVAGIIVGIVALPLAMAFAIASGVKPEQGIYTSIIAGFIVGVFGGTRAQISGPTGAFVVILAAITAEYGFAGLQVATLMGGVILCIMGLLRLGTAVKFMPYPVIIGFTSGIAVIIFVGQWKDFFGLHVSIPIDALFHEKFISLIFSLPHLDLKTTALSLTSLIILVFGSRYIKRVPAPLLAMLLATIIQSLCGFHSIATIGSVFGEIPQFLPPFGVPDFSEMNLVKLIMPAFTIALLCAIESLLSAAVVDTMSGTKHDSNQELIGQGLANVVAPFFGGFASTGAIARTVTNIRHGGNSLIAAVIHSIVLILILLVFAPYATNIPLAALSAILFVVAFNMCDIPEFVRVIRFAPWYDVMVLLVTFFLTVFLNLVTAVIIGMSIAVMLFLLRKHQTKHIKPVATSELDPKLLDSITSRGVICDLEGPFFFGVADKIENMLAVTDTEPEFVVLRFASVPFIDMTGMEALKKIIKRYYQRNIKVYICEANKVVCNKLSKIGILDKVENAMIFASVNDVAYTIKDLKN